MSWFKRSPSPEKIAVEQQTVKLDAVREKRRNALQRLMKKIDDIPLEDGLMGFGHALNDVPKNGH